MKTPGPYRAGKSDQSIVSDHPVERYKGPNARRHTEGDVECYGGHLIAESFLKDDRDFFLLAANLHNELVAAVREAQKWPEEDETGQAIDESFATPGYRRYRQMLRDVLAKVDAAQAVSA